jgi:hypothetical protein
LGKEMMRAQVDENLLFMAKLASFICNKELLGKMARKEDVRLDGFRA